MKPAAQRGVGGLAPTGVRRDAVVLVPAGLAACTALFLVGVFAPVLVVQPAEGGLWDFLALLDPDKAADDHSLSVVSGVGDLIKNGDYFIAAVILLFSGIVPIVKFAYLFWCFVSLASPAPATGWLRAVEWIGKFAMLDVFVLALALITLKSFPGGIHAGLAWGIYPFLASVLLGMALAMWILRLRGRAG